MSHTAPNFGSRLVYARQKLFRYSAKVTLGIKRQLL